MSVHTKINPNFNKSDNSFIPAINYINEKIDGINYKIVQPQLHRDIANNFHFIVFKDQQLAFSIRKIYKVKERTHIVLYSHKGNTAILKRHEYYTSNSALSFYRYCICHESMYFKGLNYVSTTFINIDLQKCINIIIQYYNMSDSRPSIQCTELNYIQANDDILYNRLVSPDSTSSNNFFRILSEVFPHVKTIVNYKSCLLLIIDALKRYTDVSDLNKITLLSDIYCLLKDDNLNHEILEGASRTEFFIKLNSIFETLFNKYFSIVNPKVLTRADIIFQKIVTIGSEEITVYLFKNMFIHNDTGRHYIIYWIYYSFSRKVYKNIVHMVPMDSVITEYGLDNRYVDTGAFINKSFDYQDQAPITHVRHGAAGRVERDTKYLFIGQFNNYNFLNGGRPIRI
jgi:hypothetical protein